MLCSEKTLQLKSKLTHKREDSHLKIFSGSSNILLSQEIAHYLGTNLAPITHKQFADKELYVQIQESIRSSEVYVIQPTCHPVNTSLMELLIMIDACSRASARQITVVLPYYGYARADRKTAGRESITAKLVSNLLVKAGADRIVAMDLHSSQIEGYFDIPIDHVFGSPVLINYIAEKQLSDLVIVSPDMGGVARARAFAKKLNDSPLAIIDKRRQAHNVAEVMNVIGNVENKTAVIVDDMIDTAGTIYEAAKTLRQKGAKQVYACATHAVFSPLAKERLSSGLFTEVIVTNTIPIPQDRQFEKLRVLSVATLLGETIRCIQQKSSVISIFE